MHHSGKILIVDDSPSVVRYLQALLENEWQVDSSANGPQALERIPLFEPDIVLLDIEMPGMSGYEVCKKIRSDSALAFMKVLFLSSRTDKQDRLLGYAVGADDYIHKPFDNDELIAKIRVFARLKTAEDQLRTLNEQLNDQVALRSRQLVDAEKLAAIGRSSAGIVHNLNQPLSGIMTIAHLLKCRYPDEPNTHLLADIASQMKGIIQSILSASYKEHCTAGTRIDLNEVLVSQVELMKSIPFFKHQVKTVLDLGQIPSYFGIYAHFSQSFGNLIKNAVDAMHTSPQKILTITSRTDNNGIWITFKDTGAGISAEDREKIFDPFFTTKPLTADDGSPTGTGLGLASCREMVESYGGNILVNSRPNEGTKFTVLLPLPGSDSRQ